MLTIDHLNVSYGANHALKDVSISIQEGEIVSIIGSNGMGKSTLLNTIAGLVPSQSGSISFNGEDITNQASSNIVKAGISLSPEDRLIFPYMSVMENLELGAYSHNKDVQPVLDKIFDYFPVLEKRKEQMGGTLSGGEQQMLTIARSLMAYPKLLMIDECSLGLAPLIVKQIFEIIEEINRDGITVLFVEQNARMALNHSDRAYVLNNGKVNLKGVSSELLNDPEIVASYLGMN